MSINGWLIVDKPYGLTSMAVTRLVKRWLRQHSEASFGAAGRHGHKLGHVGTLDPLASGILPIALGHATRLTDYLLERSKTYVFGVRWGVQTATDDAEGPIIAQAPYLPSRTEIQSILPRFVGDIWQTPPVYSALKQDGQCFYKKARKEGSTQRPERRRVRVEDIKILKHHPHNQETLLEITCYKGTYIRSVAREMAENLNTLGCLSFLRRTREGIFTVDDCNQLDNLQKLPHDIGVCSIEVGLGDILAYTVDEACVSHIRNGNAIKLHHLCTLQSERIMWSAYDRHAYDGCGFADLQNALSLTTSSLVAAVYNHKVLALGYIKCDQLQPLFQPQKVFI